MKKLLLLFTLAIISTTTFSQKNQSRNSHNFNFDNENKKIYWQKVYENGSYEDVIKLITNMGCTINYSDSLKISGFTPTHKLQMRDYKYQYSEDTPGYPHRRIYYEPCTIYFTIVSKNKGYCIKATNLVWKITTPFIMNGEMLNVGNLDINTLLIRNNGKLRSLASKYDFVILHEYLDNIFDIEKGVKTVTNITNSSI